MQPKRPQAVRRTQPKLTASQVSHLRQSFQESNQGTSLFRKVADAARDKVSALLRDVELDTGDGSKR